MQYTPRAQKAFDFAWREAQSLNRPCVDSQHLVLGLMLLGDGVHCAVLKRVGFTVESLRQVIAASPPHPEESVKIDDVVFGVSAAKALERALQEASHMHHSYVGTEHILLGLLAEETGGAADLFSTQRVDIAKTRQAILDECGYRET